MKKIRVLIAKPGLDGHDRGALVISQALRDHGMEVIYTGLRQSPAQIAQAAIQEDVDIIGLSSLSGAHNSLFPKVVEELEKRHASDIPVIGGGVIPQEDIAYLLDKGIKKVFTSGASTEELAQYIKDLIDPNHHKKSMPKQIAHIGIAVHNIDQALPFYLDGLGLAVEKIETVDSERVKVAFLPLGESYIELLEPLDESSPVYRFLETKGEGVHHIALEVFSIEERITQLKKHGIQMINNEPITGANNSQIAFLHPKSAHGVLYELCEHEEERE